jgi:hypothetical protein
MEAPKMNSRRGRKPGRRNRKPRGNKGFLGEVNVLAKKAGTHVSSRKNTPLDFGGVITPFSEASPIPTPFIPHNRIFKQRQGISAFNVSSGISGGGTHPFFTAVDSTDTFPVIAFSFQDLAQEASLANLFDQYRFDGVELIIKPSNAVVDLHAAATPNQINPQVQIVLDFDDATALTSSAAAEQYDNVVTIMGSEGAHIRLVPAVTPAVYASSVFTGYGVTGPMWLDCNSDVVPHYGVKFAVQGLSAASTEFYQWNIQCWYHVSFRNVR